MGKIIFRFSFDETHHADVIKILESVPKSMRTIFVVDAIRYSVSRVMQIPSEKLTNSEIHEEWKDTVEKKDEKILLKDKQTELNVPATHDGDTPDKNKPEKQSSGGLSVSLKNVFGSVNNLFKGE